MSNEDILKQNSGKKMDIILMNPPYSITSDNMHLKFADKVNEIANKQVSIFPISFITKHDIKSQDKYKDKWKDKLVSIEEVSSKLFNETKMPNCGIYYFDSNKQKENNIIIKYLNGDKFETKSLKELSKFSDYEKEIIKYLENNGQQPIKPGPYHLKRKYQKGDNIEDKIYNETKKNAEKNIPKDKVYLICNSINGGMNGTFFSSKVGNIIDNFEDLIKYYASIDVGNPHNIMFFNSIKEAENCKIAMKNPLLRLTCYKTQDYQRMIAKKVYKYIPAIDWSNDKVKTDEGLLEVCGCPKDKAKEYADYCKKIIEQVDKK